MPDEAPAPGFVERFEESARRNRNRWDVVAALVLALSAVLSAWAAYQSNLWSGDQADSYARASTLRASQTQHLAVASRQLQIDVSTFLQWAEAKSADNSQLATFLEARFRTEFQPAFQAWLTTAPAGTIPSGTPFDLPQYQLAEQSAADAAGSDAEAATEDAQKDNQISDNFVLVAVIFASVLFVAGIASQFEQPGIRRGLSLVAAVLFIVGAIFEFVLPQLVSL